MKLSKNKGITLIALVITIIVLLILAGISITMIIDKNGIIQRAFQAKEKTEMALLQEEAEMVRSGANIESFSGNALGENTALYKEGLLKLLNEHFEGSTRKGNRIITEDLKYDIAVKNNLEIVVVKRGENYLKKGEIDITYYVPSGSGAKSKRIELYFDLGRDEDSEAQQKYWQYAMEKLEGLSEEQLEDIFINSWGLGSKKALYQKMTGKTTKEEAENALANMGMTYKEALQLSYIRPIGDITPTLLNYVKEVKGKEGTIQDVFDSMMENEQMREKLESLGITDADSYIRYLAEKEGKTEEEEMEFFATYGIYMYIFTETEKMPLVVNNPDGTKEDVTDLLMISEFVVKQNGEYTFTVDGINGEKGEITVPVTGIGKEYEDFTDEELTKISEKTIKFVVNTGDDGKIILPVSTDERVIIDWGDGETTTNNVKDLERVNLTPADWLKHDYSQKNTEMSITLRGNVHMINSTNSTKAKLLEVTDWGESDLVYIKLANCTNLRRIASPRTDSFKNLSYVEEIFKNCSNLKTLPENLFKNCTKITSFENSFSESGIEEIPSSLFEDCTNAINFRGTFYKCTALTGIVPELWNRESNPEGYECFSFCRNVDNYDSIPEEWKKEPEPTPVH